jgi:uncharacterized damage-inducible protein DinB
MSSARSSPPNAFDAREESAMTDTSALHDAFAHHAWATIRLIDVCQKLPPQHLRHAVPGTRGPIIETLAHIVDGDTWDLDVLEARSLIEAEEAGLDLGSLREAARRNAGRWSSFVSRSTDPDAMVTEVDPADGFRRVAPVGLRLAAALQHGSDHRSQVCTALTTLEVPPPAIDVWTFGVELGRIEETVGTS